MRKKNYFKLFFTFSFPVTYKYRPQICSLSYSCPALCFHRIRSFYGFRISRKSGTDGRTRCNTQWSPLV